jgi:diguanylate cyclase (GGDEF)-like protein
MFQSIKTTLISLTVFAIVGAGAAVLSLSVFEHESFYRESVKNDLDAISEDMASDLLPLIADTPAPYSLTHFLLRLDKYKYVQYAIVFDANWQQLEVYIVDTELLPAQIKKQTSRPKLKALGIGMSNVDGSLLALKRIGDPSLPMGYLLIVKNLDGPLAAKQIQLFKQILPLSMLILCIVIAVFMGIHNRLFAPLGRLSLMAQNIEATGDYSLRIDLEGKTEVSALSKNINRMMATINHETQKNRANTEQLIEQRESMERLANTDSLTGLPNRQYFMQTLKSGLIRAERSSSKLALMYIDLDGFKDINDSLGHETGDKLLIEITKKLCSFLRTGDFLSRWGGDEFLILLYDIPDEYLLANIAERIIQGISEPLHINDWEVSVTASVGIALAGDANFKLSEFISNADIAMYSSKSAGRASHSFFVPAMMEHNKRKMLIASLLLPALNKQEFSLYYQPKVSPSGQVIGFEALLRWEQEKLGWVSPAEFVPLAEKSGKINLITRWVLQRLCQDLPVIHKRLGRPVCLAVNLSANDIKVESFMGFIQGLFEEYQVDPKFIEFEVTESTYLENFSEANHFLEQIHQMGSSIALDDFGTGYSSLSYLTKIPIDTLKIDKQFVDNLDLSLRSNLITQTIIEMAKQLNLNICAEGVETQEQADFLIKHGCHQLQGYLYGKPQPLDNICAPPI